MVRHFGVLVPSTNTTLEIECRLLPATSLGKVRPGSIAEKEGLCPAYALPILQQERGEGVAEHMELAVAQLP